MKDWLKDEPESAAEAIEQERWWNEQAMRIGPELLKDKLGALLDVVLTYRDDKAEDAAWRVREWFWGGAIQDAIKAARAAAPTAKEGE